MGASRTEERRDYTDKVRLSLLERDVDELHSGIAGMRSLLFKILLALLSLLITVLASLATYIITQQGGA